MVQEVLAFLDTLPSGMFDLAKGKPVATGATKRSSAFLRRAAGPPRQSDARRSPTAASSI
jgi:hypothetical protein